jgi:hypothetical protein
MRGDYLWDKSSPSDPEVKRIEELLSPYATSPRDMAFLGKVRPVHGHRIGPLMGAVAATIMVALTAAWFFTVRPAASWRVAAIEGVPIVSATPIGKHSRLAVGELLETDSRSRAKVDVGRIGEVEVEPGSRLKLLASRTTEHRLELQRGGITAFITAPPRLFYVNTPSAVAVDMGCAYTLEVDEAGASYLRVIVGWVAFEWEGRESFVPAGAVCRTRPGGGPGLPYYLQSSDELRAAVARYDVSPNIPDLRVILREASQRDVLTLWHLLTRNEDDRAEIVDRMLVLLPPPPGVTREGVLKGDRTMLDRWWNALGIRDVLWWRLWKGPWPPASK